MNIRDLINRRILCPYRRNMVDTYLENAVSSKSKEVYIVLPQDALNDYSEDKNNGNKITLFGTRKLRGMFELGACNPKSYNKYVFYVFSNERPENITIGVLEGEVFEKKHHSANTADINSLFEKDYKKYLKDIEKWVTSNNASSVRSDSYYFSTIKTSEFGYNYNPRNNCDEYFRVQKALEKEKTVELYEVAEVIKPRPDENNKKATQLIFHGWKYPMDYSETKEGVLTNTPIQKNDILFKDFDHIYLVDEEPTKELHISPNHYIIRPTGILPTYLYMYLRSHTAQIVLKSLSMGSIISRIRYSEIKKIPVIMPSLEDQEYNTIFRLQNYKANDISEYYNYDKESSTERIIAYAQKAKEIRRKTENVKKKEGIANILEEEWKKNIVVCKDTEVRKLIYTDIDEINACYNAKAYKAAIIMAGSVLEAVLLDWLSELRGKDFFNNPYYVRKQSWDKKNKCYKKDKNGNDVYYTKEATLADYIDEVKGLARPEWMKSDEAVKIKDMRNNVHAKLCLKDGVVINRETCKEIIQYLKEVVETRNNQTQSTN